MERKIILGFVTSTDFTNRIKGKWNIHLFESQIAKRLAMWCSEYFDKYNKAPGSEIESIFQSKKRKGLPKEISEEIEEDILPDLSEEFESSDFNIDYLVEEAELYFAERHLKIHNEEVQGLLEQGQIIEAQKLVQNYKPLSVDSGSWVDFSDEKIFSHIDDAFGSSKEILIHYPGALGEFWNDQLYRGAFVALEAVDKMGKSFWLKDFAMKAIKERRNVAYFQCGDMDLEDEILRTANYITQKSELEKYSGKLWHPLKDCIYNQTDHCDKPERQCNFELFRVGKEHLDKFRYEITKDKLIQAYKDNPGYETCHNCSEFEKSHWGTVFLKEIDNGKPLTKKEAKKAWDTFFVKTGRQFRMSVHPTNTLTVKQAEAILDSWAKDGFVADVAIFDYMDIMLESFYKDKRLNEDKKWVDMRAMTQRRKLLGIAATQADADAYGKYLLKADNFSETKGKNAHVTAMYGLNQDSSGREKELGIIRINEIVKRKGYFSSKNQVYVLQNLSRGRPFLTSFI